MNVLSPLRYSGGKTKLYNKVNYITTNNKLNSTIYVEPFAGGCGLALKLLFNNNVKELILNDLDYCIYAVWFCILNQTQELIDLINNVINTSTTPLFINFDPPYYNKGCELYTNYYKPENHIKLKNSISTVKQPWITAYDDCDFISKLYNDYKQEKNH